MLYLQNMLDDLRDRVLGPGVEGPRAPGVGMGWWQCPGGPRARVGWGWTGPGRVRPGKDQAGTEPSRFEARGGAGGSCVGKWVNQALCED